MGEIVALALSWLFPGLGQFYNGEKTKAIAFFILGIAFIVSAIILSDNWGPGILLFSVLWIVGIIDAYKTAKSKSPQKFIKSINDEKKFVEEYKRTCRECGKVWHSLVAREKQIQGNIKSNACSGMGATCGGSWGGATQSVRNREASEEILDKLRKCPNCGSKNFKQVIIHYEKK